ncbi:hypothetical protein BKA70DRAFT_1408958 [Coprinopsis sp. MPI-PUGE-AT-0042]|nr:hypothetical protein BKA70DRAFT_1408958 [Coprinopsis sp. MPI-PUGE-AT-0042]
MACRPTTSKPPKVEQENTESKTLFQVSWANESTLDGQTEIRTTGTMIVWHHEAWHWFFRFHATSWRSLEHSKRRRRWPLKATLPFGPSPGTFFHGKQDSSATSAARVVDKKRTGVRKVDEERVTCVSRSVRKPVCLFRSLYSGSTFPIAVGSADAPGSETDVVTDSQAEEMSQADQVFQCDTLALSRFKDDRLGSASQRAHEDGIHRQRVVRWWEGIELTITASEAAVPLLYICFRLRVCIFVTVGVPTNIQSPSVRSAKHLCPARPSYVALQRTATAERQPTATSPGPAGVGDGEDITKGFTFRLGDLIKYPLENATAEDFV